MLNFLLITSLQHYKGIYWCCIENSKEKKCLKIVHVADVLCLRSYVELPVEIAMIFISEKLKDDCMTEKLSIVNIFLIKLDIPVCIDNAVMRQ